MVRHKSYKQRSSRREKWKKIEEKPWSTEGREEQEESNGASLQNGFFSHPLVSRYFSVSDKIHRGRDYPGPPYDKGPHFVTEKISNHILVSKRYFI